MGQQRDLEDALLFLAISFRPEIKYDWIVKEIVPQFGDAAEVSAPFDFSHSHYYQEEMGQNLKKIFLFFKGFYDVAQVVETKIQSNQIERQYSVDSRRTINLDPGYLTLAKLVLSTTKNFDHRIHIASGIYGDIQLRFRHGKFVENPWTYPDYKDQKSIDFFIKARHYLQEMVKNK